MKAFECAQIKSTKDTMQVDAEPVGSDEKVQHEWRERLELLARDDWKNLQRFIYHRLRNTAETEEIAQQTFFEAVRSIHRFRAQAELRTWVYAIALNLVSNHVRRSPTRRYQFESTETLLNIPCSAADPDDALNARRLLAKVMQHIALLPTEMRETVQLVLLDDVSYADAARRQAVPVGTIRSRVSRARGLIRAALSEQYNITPTEISSF